MIRTFRHPELAKFRDLVPSWPWQTPMTKELIMILDVLDSAELPEDADFAGIRFDQWDENDRTRYGISLNERWLVSFAWDDKDAVDVDFELIN